MTNDTPTLQSIEQCAKETIEKNGHHHPMIIMMSTDKNLQMYILKFNDNQEKQHQLQHLRKQIIEENIVKYWIIMEAWQSNDVFVMPSQDKRRREVIVILEFSKEHESKMIILPFRREQNTVIWEEKILPGEVDSLVTPWNFYMEDTIDEIVQKEKITESYKRIDNLDKKSLERITQKMKAVLNSPTLTENEVKKLLKQEAKKLIENCDIIKKKSVCDNL